MTSGASGMSDEGQQVFVKYVLAKIEYGVMQYWTGVYWTERLEHALFHTKRVDGRDWPKGSSVWLPVYWAINSNGIRRMQPEVTGNPPFYKDIWTE